MSESLHNLFTQPWCILASGRLLFKKRHYLISTQTAVPCTKGPIAKCVTAFCTYSGQYRANSPGLSEQISSKCIQLGGFGGVFPLLELHSIKVSHTHLLSPLCKGQQDFEVVIPLSLLSSPAALPPKRISRDNGESWRSCCSHSPPISPGLTVRGLQRKGTQSYNGEIQRNAWVHQLNTRHLPSKRGTILIIILLLAKQIYIQWDIQRYPVAMLVAEAGTRVTRR